jgi:hypothetical protein
MLGIDGRAARYAWTAALVLLLLVLVYFIGAKPAYQIRR